MAKSKPKRTFTATIEASDSGGAYIAIPFDVEEAFGSKRPKVKATFNGEPYRGTAVRMGTECHLLIVRKDIREKIDSQPGDTVKVTLELDTAPRSVDVPDDFRKALNKSKKVAAFFEGLAYTHRKEYVQWITDAKREETRRRRIEKAVDMLREGRKTTC